MELINLNEISKSAIQIARSLAVEYGNAFFYPGHLLQALLHRNISIRGFIESLNADIRYLEEWAEVRMEDYPKGHVAEIVGDDGIDRVLEEADKVRLKLGLLEIDPICLLAALARPGIGFTANQLKTFPLREKDILDSLLDKGNMPTNRVSTVSGVQPSPNSMLLKYCIDKTLMASEQKIHPVIRRDREIRMMVEILGRHSRPNVIITGEAGVGKTALVDGLACHIASDIVPDYLKGATILELDMGALVAGATYKGEIEERLKNIINEIRQMDKTILFIDEIHILLDTRSGNSGASNILKQELSKGELTVIGATTTDEYRKLIEPDHAFNRRFEEISLLEPDTESATAIISEIHTRYALHHNVDVNKEAISCCVQLAKRYIKNRKLPDAAIDLLDRTMASVKMINETASETVRSLLSRLSQIALAEDQTKEHRLQQLMDLHFTIQNQLSPILLSIATSEGETFSMEDDTQFSAYLEKKLRIIEEIVKNKITEITPQELSSVIAAKTGIPVGKIQSGEKEKLMKMEDYLRRRVVGQDLALKVLADAILESRSGMNKPGQPIGSFFLLGPTGTGKTELAKALAEVLFNDEKAMIRFDMSEFKEEHSAALLYGAPPGYVGYEEGGLLVNKIRQQPYAVVLFDEIEKAHPSVYDIFLQIMDEGKLHDRLGKEGDFSNAIVLFTSNVGSEWLTSQTAAGKSPTSYELMEVMGHYFRPEFLARLSEIVPFSPINESMLLQIFNIQFNEFEKILERQGITIKLTSNAASVLSSKDFVPKYGARQIAGTIRNQLRRPISRLLITGKISRGSHIKISTDEQGSLVWEYGLNNFLK